MPKYTLTYFNARGRAEISRVILAVAKVPYDDVRLTQEEWGKYKSKTPMGFLPVLKIDGKGELTQSTTIARFLAREFGLAGKDNYEEGVVDMALCTFEDILALTASAVFEKNPEKQAEMERKIMGETVPQTLQNLEKIAGRGGFFVGSSLTAADLGLYNFVDGEPDTIKAYPKLTEIYQRVDAIKEVKQWVSKRPKTDF